MTCRIFAFKLHYTAHGALSTPPFMLFSVTHPGTIPNHFPQLNQTDVTDSLKQRQQNNIEWAAHIPAKHLIFNRT